MASHIPTWKPGKLPDQQNIPEVKSQRKSSKNLPVTPEMLSFSKVPAKELKAHHIQETWAYFPAQDSPKEKKAVAQKFEVGDVVFARFTKHISLKERVDMGISFAQKIVNLLRRKKDQEGLHRVTHAAIVVEVDKVNGRVLVAEAMPTGKKNELRVIDLLSDHSMVLGAKDPFEYQVMRMKDDKNLPKEAAKIAERVASKASYLLKAEDKQTAQSDKGEHQFSFLQGLIAIFSKGSKRTDSEVHAKRLFKKVADEYLKHQKVTGNQRDRKFFCSNFAAHAFQQAELSQKLDNITKIDGVEQGLKEIEKLEGRARNQQIRLWARKMAKEHGSEIRQAIETFKLDPKRTSPQELAEFLKREELFVPVLTIIPPNK